MPGSATESDYIEQLNEARKECARERERRMELERKLERLAQKISGLAHVRPDDHRDSLARKMEAINDECRDVLL